MLREDVVAAVKNGKFHVWAARTVDEGIEVLTGRAAGVRGPDGSFPSHTINGLVEARLNSFAQTLKESSDTPQRGK
jgi:predicted ATP-dependent protease